MLLTNKHMRIRVSTQKHAKSRTLKGLNHATLQNSPYCFKILCSRCDKTFYRSRMTKFHKLTLYDKRWGQNYAWSFTILRISFNGWMIFNINSTRKYSQRGGLTGKGSTSWIGCLDYSHDLCWHFRSINVTYKADFISHESKTLHFWSITIMIFAKIQADSIRTQR